MQRKFSLELNENSYKYSKQIQKFQSQNQVSLSNRYETQFKSESLLDQQDEFSYLTHMRCEVQDLSNNLAKKLSFQENKERHQRELTLLSSLSKDILSQKTISLEKQQKKKLGKKISIYSVQTTHSSQFGQQILNDDAFRNSLAQLILQKEQQ